VKTVVIQIGNSDNKLTQNAWSRFVYEMLTSCKKLSGNRIHFHACSEGAKPWQNACWVLDGNDIDLKELRADLARYARRYKQDSIALTIGTTELITPSCDETYQNWLNFFKELSDEGRNYYNRDER
jgi:hypothetical protein